MEPSLWSHLSMRQFKCGVTTHYAIRALVMMAEDGRGKASGYFVQASYLIKKKFRPTIQYGTLDYLDNGALLGRKPTDFDAKALALGMNFYLTQTIVFKVEYDVIGEGARKTKVANDFFALQAAVRF